MFKMINIENKSLCTGCSACADSCNINAIDFIVDNEGFNYPVVDMTKCVDCGRCEQVCPIINVEKLKETNKFSPKYYAAIINDNKARTESTSGGVFSVLADEMFDNNGLVCGAVYNDDFSDLRV